MAHIVSLICTPWDGIFEQYAVDFGLKIVNFSMIVVLVLSGFDTK